MQAHHKIRHKQLTNSAKMDSVINDDSASPVKVEKVLKEFKTQHRCAMDFDSSFCKAVFFNDVHPQGDTEA